MVCLMPCTLGPPLWHPEFHTSDIATVLGRSTITMCAGRMVDEDRLVNVIEVVNVRIESVLVRSITPPLLSAPFWPPSWPSPCCRHPQK